MVQTRVNGLVRPFNHRKRRRCTSIFLSKTLHITYILYLLSLGFDNWPRPRSNVPTPRLAHDANLTALAPYRLCQSSNGNWDGWLRCASLHYGLAGIKIWDWVFAAIVRTIDAPQSIFETNCSFFFIFLLNAGWYP
jgi:hypothetical protein